MKKELNDTLKYEINLLDKAKENLEYSFNKCVNADIDKEFTNEELEQFEAMTSRFARLSDIFIQKILRLIDEIELETDGTVRDRINRAEKKGIIEDAAIFIEIRILRNSISHEYIVEALRDIFKKIIEYTPYLINGVNNLKKYSGKYINK